MRSGSSISPLSRLFLWFELFYLSECSNMCIWLNTYSEVIYLQHPDDANYYPGDTIDFERRRCIGETPAFTWNSFWYTSVDGTARG